MNNHNRHRAGHLGAGDHERHRSDHSYVGRESGRDRRAAEPTGHPLPGPGLPPWLEEIAKREKKKKKVNLQDLPGLWLNILGVSI